MTDELIQQYMDAQHIAGLAIAIKQGDDILVASYTGYANLEHQVPVTAETVFEIASVTKLFTAQAILLLAQEGQLNLSDRLSQHLPDIPPAWQDVTIKHCLTHQSGIPSYTNIERYWEITRDDKSHDALLALVREMPLTFASGTRQAYDNTGFYLLGLVIGQVSGETYGTFLKDRIFTPLGMKHTQANDYTQVIPNRAQGYGYQDDCVINKDFYSISNTFSAGVLLSTVPDLLTWGTALFDDRILNSRYRQLWWTAYPSDEGNERGANYSMGLGWFIVDSPLGKFYGHNGSIAGFVSSFLYFPSTDVTAIVLCNAGHISEPHQIAFDLIKQLKIKG